MSGPASLEELGAAHPMQSLRPILSSDAFVTTVLVNDLSWSYKKHSMASVAVLPEPLGLPVLPAVN